MKRPCEAALCSSLCLFAAVFKTLDYKRIYDSMQKPAFMFDGRNILDLDALAEIGFQVWGVGKTFASIGQ